MKKRKGKAKQKEQDPMEDGDALDYAEMLDLYGDTLKDMPRMHIRKTVTNTAC